LYIFIFSLFIYIYILLLIYIYIYQTSFCCFIWHVSRPSTTLQTKSGWETCRLCPGENKIIITIIKCDIVMVEHLEDESEWRASVLTCREAMSRMKEGEENKTKSYTALVWTQKPIRSEDIAFIDDIKVSLTHTHTHTRTHSRNSNKVCCRLGWRLRILNTVDPPSGPDSGPEDPPEGSAPAGAGGPSAGRPPHDRSLPGPPSLPPGAEDAGRHVSSCVCLCVCACVWWTHECINTYNPVISCSEMGPSCIGEYFWVYLICRVLFMFLMYLNAPLTTCSWTSAPATSKSSSTETSAAPNPTWAFCWRWTRTSWSWMWRWGAQTSVCVCYIFIYIF